MNLEVGCVRCGHLRRAQQRFQNTLTDLPLPPSAPFLAAEQRELIQQKSWLNA